MYGLKSEYMLHRFEVDCRCGANPPAAGSAIGPPLDRMTFTMTHWLAFRRFGVANTLYLRIIVEVKGSNNLCHSETLLTTLEETLHLSDARVSESFKHSLFPPDFSGSIFMCALGKEAANCPMLRSLEGHL